MMKSEEITQSQGYHKVLEERKRGERDKRLTEREEFIENMALGNTETPRNKYDLIERDAFDGT